MEIFFSSFEKRAADADKIRKVIFKKLDPEACVEKIRTLFNRTARPSEEGTRVLDYRKILRGPTLGEVVAKKQKQKAAANRLKMQEATS